MRKVLAVAWRDFKQTVLTRTFLFAIVGVPLMFVGIGAAFVLLAANHKEPPLVGTLAVIDGDGEVARLAAGLFNEAGERDDGTDVDGGSGLGGGMGAALGPGMGMSGGLAPPLARGEVRVHVESIEGEPDGVPADVRERLVAGDYLAVAVVGSPVLSIDDTAGRAGRGPAFDLLIRDNVDSDHVGLMEHVLANAVVRVRAIRAGLDPDATLALLVKPPVRTRKLLANGEETDEREEFRILRQWVIPMIFMFLIWGSAFTCGQQLLTSTIEEKSSRVMEVLLSAVSPLQLMTGKILGQGLVGLLLMSVYSSLSMATLFVAAKLDLVETQQLIYLFVFFIMAFFMVAALMAAVGSAVSDIREANSLLTPVMVILTIPVMLWWSISQAPNGTLATTFSFIPPAIPFVMMLRLSAEEAVPTWQIPVAIIWGTACTLGMVWFAARIFRIGVLMQGKPPSPMELIRWFRYS